MKDPLDKFTISSILAGIFIAIGLAFAITGYIYKETGGFDLAGLFFISAGFISLINATYKFVTLLNSDTSLLLSREDQKLQEQIDEI